MLAKPGLQQAGTLGREGLVQECDRIVRHREINTGKAKALPGRGCESAEVSHVAGVVSGTSEQRTRTIVMPELVYVARTQLSITASCCSSFSLPFPCKPAILLPQHSGIACLAHAPTPALNYVGGLS